MASRTGESAPTLQHTMAEHKDGSIVEPQVREQSITVNDAWKPEQYALNLQNTQGNKTTTNKTPGSSSPLSSGDGVQFHDPVQGRVRAKTPTTMFTTDGSKDVDVDVCGASSSTFLRLTSPLAPGSQVQGSSPVQQSLEPRYSPPNLSAVSSSLASPVTPSFPRIRHPRSESPAHASSSPTAVSYTHLTLPTKRIV